jgi:hypothetical protein
MKHSTNFHEREQCTCLGLLDSTFGATEPGEILMHIFAERKGIRRLRELSLNRRCRAVLWQARNPRWWEKDTPKVFCRPGTNNLRFTDVNLPLTFMYVPHRDAAHGGTERFGKNSKIRFVLLWIYIHPTGEKYIYIHISIHVSPMVHFSPMVQPNGDRRKC